MIEVGPALRENYSWIEGRAGLTAGAEFRAIEATDRGRILGMVGFDGWTPNSCTVHIAIDHPIALRRLVTHSFRTAFLGLKKGVLLASVLGTNTKSLNFTRKLGFKEKARLCDAYQVGVDIVLFEMRREECRWL